MVRIAHLTDPHVGPLPRARLRELLGKRITGWYNWHRGRGAAHDMELLAGLVADIRAQEPDHVVCTGDICNIGLASEWPTARVFLEGLGEPDRVSFVPGNHDAYIRGSLEGLLSEIAPWTRGDGEAEPRFPYLRRRGAVAVVGLSSAVPTLPFMATGRVGRAQIEAAGRLLAALAEDDVF
ncbi:MAG TPA: metallophosphoesterase, partial [Beijerinckiaceae bacterium]|nr:metallophosphoesterase [Beijerinckiaceae bacterium]